MNIKSRYKGTYLGLLWTALEPTFTFLLLYIVFTTIRIRGGENFAIYLLTGIILYHIFSRGTLSGLSSLQTNKGIIQSFHMKYEFFPVTVSLATAILVTVQMGVFFALMLFFQYIPPITIVAFPLILLLLITLITGLTYILSIAFVYFKDIQPIWGVIVHAFFFVSPIFWYVKDAHEILQLLFAINPIGQIIELAHSLVIYGLIPPMQDWLYTSVIVGGIFFGGYFIFQKFEKRISEEI
jgi:ABC-type polysaccharide/polyol phosphate export permease